MKKTAYNGVEFGMSVVKKLVDQMGGTIEVDSQIGKGSVIRITLHLQIDQVWNARPVEKEQNARGDVAGMRVLLVEDNELNCEIVEFMLKEAGAEMVTAKPPMSRLGRRQRRRTSARAQAALVPDLPEPWRIKNYRRYQAAVIFCPSLFSHGKKGNDARNLENMPLYGTGR